MNVFFKNKIIWFILISIGVLAYAVSGLLEEELTKKTQDSIIITNAATGEQQITNDPKAHEVLKLMQGMREKKRLARKNAPSAEKRKKLYKSVIEEIEAHMIDPAPGQYPVTFFDPDKVPLIKGLGEGPIRPPSYWIDNNSILYHGYNYYQNNPKVSILVLNSKDGAIKEVVTAAYIPDSVHLVCFNRKTRRLLYTEYLKDKAGRILRFGRLNADFTFTEEFNSGGERGKYSYGNLDCEAVTREEIASGVGLNNIYWPEDGKLSYKIKMGTVNERVWGALLWTRPDGTVKEIKLDGWTTMHPENPRYDPVSDRYFLTSRHSDQDQRIKVWWFDRQFNLVEEYVLPRVQTYSTYPTTSLYIAARDGFVTPCGHRDDEPGNLDPWGKQKHSYLCLVTPKDGGKIIRILKGKVGGGLAVSPDGCRVFGFWQPYTKARAYRDGGKNFVVDLCAAEK